MNAPNCRLFPNELYEIVMGMSEAEIKVGLAVWSETFSLGKTDVLLSTADLERITGLSTNSVLSGIKGCIDTGVIVRKRDGHGYRYALKVGDIENDPEETPKTKTPNVQWQMMTALGSVMRMDVKINSARLGKLAKELLASSYTPEQVKKAYGQGGRYWIEDWRGKKMSPPNERTIRETIALYSTETLVTEKTEKPIKRSEDGGLYF